MKINYDLTKDLIRNTNISSSDVNSTKIGYSCQYINTEVYYRPKLTYLRTTTPNSTELFTIPWTGYKSIGFLIFANEWGACSLYLIQKRFAAGVGGVYPYQLVGINTVKVEDSGNQNQIKVTSGQIACDVYFLPLCY